MLSFPVAVSFCPCIVSPRPIFFLGPILLHFVQLEVMWHRKSQFLSLVQFCLILSNLLHFVQFCFTSSNLRPCDTGTPILLFSKTDHNLKLAHSIALIWMDRFLMSCHLLKRGNLPILCRIIYMCLDTCCLLCTKNVLLRWRSRVSWSGIWYFTVAVKRNLRT